MTLNVSINLNQLKLLLLIAKVKKMCIPFLEKSIKNGWGNRFVFYSQLYREMSLMSNSIEFHI